ncbi:MAG: hypothetical protein RKO66_00445 [Candidatus Contendobacter sp.]|nr:hypothetical protein [Candidatus Contendobacter sp.]
MEAHTVSRLQGSPAGCGALHTGGVNAKMQTFPSLQSASLLHSSAAKDACAKDTAAIIAIGNRNFLNMLFPFLRGLRMETTPSIGLDFVNLFRCVIACSPMMWWVEETVMSLSRQPGVQQ